MSHQYECASGLKRDSWQHLAFFLISTKVMEEKKRVKEWGIPVEYTYFNTSHKLSSTQKGPGQLEGTEPLQITVSYAIFLLILVAGF